MVYKEITVRGKVQGVFFRKSTKEKALSLNIKGTVENRDDDSVYIKATGEKEKMDEFIKWTHEGPGRAVVENVDVTDIGPFEANDFIINR